MSHNIVVPSIGMETTEREENFVICWTSGQDCWLEENFLKAGRFPTSLVADHEFGEHCWIDGADDGADDIMEGRS